MLQKKSANDIIKKEYMFGGVFVSKTPLKEKQQLVYNFLVQKRTEGIPPTVREICNATGISSTSTVHAILTALEDYGYISVDRKNSRGIRILGEAPSSMAAFGLHPLG